MFKGSWEEHRGYLWFRKWDKPFDDCCCSRTNVRQAEFFFFFFIVIITAFTVDYLLSYGKSSFRDWQFWMILCAFWVKGMTRCKASNQKTQFCFCHDNMKTKILCFYIICSITKAYNNKLDILTKYENILHVFLGICRIVLPLAIMSCINFM